MFNEIDLLGVFSDSDPILLYEMFSLVVLLQHVDDMEDILMQRYTFLFFFLSFWKTATENILRCYGRKSRGLNKRLEYALCVCHILDVDVVN